jgi:hypothetical protein
LTQRQPVGQRTNSSGVCYSRWNNGHLGDCLP